jgi:glutamate N-acetyltransferase / amino-acid N-acetyltransferase
MTDEILLPQGFRAAGIHCGVKSDDSIRDLCLFVSDQPASLAGVFTQNQVVGAPVTVSRERCPNSNGRAVLINSGNANACTGARGIDDARWMTAQAAQLLGCEDEAVVVCSTGIIGHFLPREALADGIPNVVAQLNSDSASLQHAAEAMMTTDTFAKLICRDVVINHDGRVSNQSVRVTAVAKGAAMIGPNMATMLSVILTDAELSVAQCDQLLRHAVNRSFNCISVEGHTSTSDTVFLFANGVSNSGTLDDAALEILQAAIDDVAMEMAQAIIKDAEGADHFITIDVNGGRSREESFAMAKEIADSALVKTAVTGADPNWGRIISAAGYAGVSLKDEDMSLWVNDVLIYEDGAPTEYDESALSESMKNNRDVSIRLELTHGDANVRFWTSDLTAEYVRLNSEYTT